MNIIILIDKYKYLIDKYFNRDLDDIISSLKEDGAICSEINISNELSYYRCSGLGNDDIITALIEKGIIEIERSMDLFNVFAYKHTLDKLYSNGNEKILKEFSIYSKQNIDIKSVLDEFHRCGLITEDILYSSLLTMMGYLNLPCYQQNLA
jgi:hypothetical protein